MPKDPELYGAPSAFANRTQFLRGIQPAVLPLRQPRSLDVASRLNVTFELPQSLATYNPSIARAPPGLCPRCTWLAAMRADGLHQCADGVWQQPEKYKTGRKQAHRNWFKSTMIAVYDANWRTLGWTWLLSSPTMQVRAPGAPPPSCAGCSAFDTVEAGVADGFNPPLLKQVWDARLLNDGSGHVFVNFNCKSCVLAINHLFITGDATSDGGVTNLRSWSRRIRPIMQPWAQGRNQAAFVGADGALMLQPWLGLVGRSGTPRFTPRAQPCKGGGTLELCASTPYGSTLKVDAIFGGEYKLRLIHNDSLSDLRVADGSRLSTTANLVPIRRADGCSVLLGVGHLHRHDGPRQRELVRREQARRGAGAGGRRRRPAAAAAAAAPAERFEFGSQYTHFWYALDVQAPHRIVATSGEWCLAAARDPLDCESVQFVSGIAVADGGDDLVVSYGVSDCEAKAASVPLRSVWAALVPRGGAGETCVGTS